MNSRHQAMRYLMQNVTVDMWPENMDRYVTGRLFGNWRFVDTLPDREIVFANGLEECITLSQFKDSIQGILQ